MMVVSAEQQYRLAIDLARLYHSVWMGAEQGRRQAYQEASEKIRVIDGYHWT
jgi:hypothetical protein